MISVAAGLGSLFRRFSHLSFMQFQSLVAQRAGGRRFLLTVVLVLVVAVVLLTFTSARGLYPPLVVLAATAVAVQYGNWAGVSLAGCAGLLFLVVANGQGDYSGLDLVLTGLSVPLWMLIVGSGGAFAAALRQRDAALAASAKELAHRSMHDPLTGLANRTLLSDRLTLALARSRRHHLRIAVFFLDLDGFKEINDAYGHSTGDQVLIEVAHRLRNELREMDTAARLGGDEFVLLCEDIADDQEVLIIRDRLAAALSGPVILAARELPVGASIGIAVSGSTLATAEDLLRAADAAMYRAKGMRMRADVEP